MYIVKNQYHCLFEKIQIYIKLKDKARQGEEVYNDNLSGEVIFYTMFSFAPSRIYKCSTKDKNNWVSSYY